MSRFDCPYCPDVSVAFQLPGIVMKFSLDFLCLGRVAVSQNVPASRSALVEMSLAAADILPDGTMSHRATR